MSTIRPKVQLIGQDSNVYNLLGLCRRAALRQGWTQHDWETFKLECLNEARDYHDVLGKIMERFEVE